MWSYEWVELTQEVELLVRYQFVETLDKMQKLHSEPLAYITGTYYRDPIMYHEWTAYGHKPGFNTEEPEPLFATTQDYKALRIEVQEYFRNKPDEGNTVPSSAV